MADMQQDMQQEAQQGGMPYEFYFSNWHSIDMNNPDVAQAALEARQQMGHMALCGLGLMGPDAQPDVEHTREEWFDRLVCSWTGAPLSYFQSRTTMSYDFESQLTQPPVPQPAPGADIMAELQALRQELADTRTQHAAEMAAERAKHEAEIAGMTGEYENLSQRESERADMATDAAFDAGFDAGEGFGYNKGYEAGQKAILDDLKAGRLRGPSMLTRFKTFLSNTKQTLKEEREAKAAGKEPIAEAEGGKIYTKGFFKRWACDAMSHARMAFDYAKSSVKNIGYGVAGAALYASDKVQDGVRAVKAAPKKLAGFVHDKAVDIKTGVTERADALRVSAANRVDAVKAGVTERVDAVKGKALEARDTAVSGVQEGMRRGVALGKSLSDFMPKVEFKKPNKSLSQFFSTARNIILGRDRNVSPDMALQGDEMVAKVDAIVLSMGQAQPVQQAQAQGTVPAPVAASVGQAVVGSGRSTKDLDAAYAGIDQSESEGLGIETP